MFNRKPNKIKKPIGDSVLDVFTSVVLILIIIVVGYPVLYVISASFSSAGALQTGRVWFLPVEPSIDGYRFVLQYKQVWIGYRNTVVYTFISTIITIIMEILCAYPLSRPHFRARKKYTTYMLVIMLVHAGLVPNFLVKTALGLYTVSYTHLTLPTKA